MIDFKLQKLPRNTINEILIMKNMRQKWIVFVPDSSETFGFLASPCRARPYSKDYAAHFVRPNWLTPTSYSPKPMFGHSRSASLGTGVKGGRMERLTWLVELGSLRREIGFALRS